MKLGHKSRKVGGRQTRKTRSWFKLPKHYSRLHKLISYLFDSLLENSNLVKVIKKGCFLFLFFSSIGIASWNHVSNGMRRVVRRNGKVWWYCKCMEPEKMRRGTSAIAGSKARREKEREGEISTYQNAHDLHLKKNVVPHHCQPSLRIIHESVFTSRSWGKKVQPKGYKNKHEMLW